MANDEWIRLNVGGHIYMTTRGTLSKESESLLAKMFGAQSKWSESALCRDSSGAYFLDASPRHFEPILSFLRRGEVIIDDGVSLRGVLAEARYFGIEPLVAALTKQLADKDELESPLTGFYSPQQGEGALTWHDIGGLSGVKKELQQVVELSVRYKHLYERWAVTPSRNILLYGPPGCGKTLLARVTANQIRANCMLVRCPELLNEPDNAVHRLQERFKAARSMEPCVMFLDEFECIAQGRAGSGVDSSRLMSQLAISLDQVAAGAENTFVIAATNRPDLIEPALLRPGRFDQLIYIPLPDREARHEILSAHLRRVPIGSAVDLAHLAASTRGLSGADLKEVCQRACKFAIREHVEQSNSDSQVTENGNGVASSSSSSSSSGADADLSADTLLADDSSESICVTEQHFEQAMAYSRRSVSERDVYRHINFNNMLQQISAQKFHFPPQPQQQQQQQHLVDESSESQES
jgi:DNA polymerase III delta prime subunit